jgi:flagellar motor switch/type III secretory pathway protein FliN
MEALPKRVEKDSVIEPLPKIPSLDKISIEIYNLIASRAISAAAAFKETPAQFCSTLDYPMGFNPDCRLTCEINGFLVYLVVEKNSVDVFFELGLGVPYSKLSQELSQTALAWFSDFLSAGCQQLTGRLAIRVTAIDSYIIKRQEEANLSTFSCEMSSRKFHFALLRHSPEVNQHFIRWLKKFPLKASALNKEDILINVGVNKGFTLLSQEDLLQLAAGDLILMDQWAPDHLYLTTPSQEVMTIERRQNKTVAKTGFLSLKHAKAQNYIDFQSLINAVSQKKPIENLPVLLRFQVAEESIRLSDLEKYQLGVVVPYSHSFAISQTSVCIKEKVIAAGEIVSVNGKLAVQITNFIS